MLVFLCQKAIKFTAKEHKQMLKLTTENTVKAIERCRQLKPRVKALGERYFAVYSSRNASVYHVRFAVRNGDKLGQCECKASEKGLICYHIIAGATANIYRQSLKRMT